MAIRLPFTYGYDLTNDAHFKGYAYLATHVITCEIGYCHDSNVVNEILVAFNEDFDSNTNFAQFYNEIQDHIFSCHNTVY